jgi:RHS repeat-associated protein
MVTDTQGTCTERHDYLSFGVEIGRTLVPCFTSLTSTVRLKFTGKERDETGLDYFGARYFSGAQGRFTSPDDVLKDSHVADPQSWNKYAYARNNPLRYIDPSGGEATETTTCSVNGQNQTVCQVNIQASVAIYAAPGSNLDQQQLNAAANTITNSIQGAWSGQFQQDGVTYNVNTSVNVQVVSDEAAGMQSGAQNVIGLTNGNAGRNADSFVNPRSFFGAISGSGPDTGTWNINNLGNGIAAHEFTHLLGVENKLGQVLSNTNILNDPAIPHNATPNDLRWGVREATTGNTWQVRGTIMQSPGASATTVRQVQAAWRWWK